MRLFILLLVAFAASVLAGHPMPGCAVSKYPNTDLNKQAEDMPEHLYCPSHQEDWMLIKGYPLHLQISSLHRAYIILLCKEMPSLEEEW